MRFALCLPCCLLGFAVPQTFAQFKLDIGKVADSIGSDLGSLEEPESAEDEEEQMMFNRVVFRVGKNELETRNMLEMKLAGAIRKIAKSSNLNEAQQEKLKLAGKVDVARLLAEMRVIRDRYGRPNRQNVIQLVNELRPAHERIRSLFRTRSGSHPLRFEEPNSLFERVANTLLGKSEVGPLPENTEQLQLKKVATEIKETLEALKSESNKAKLKQARLKQQGKLK